MEKITDRIGIFIQSQNISVRAFEISIGASNGSIGRAISKKTDIGSNWISKIIEIYPIINIEWLITGVGQMIREGSNNDQEKNTKTKSVKNVVNENDHKTDHIIDHKRKVQKTWSINGESLESEKIAKTKCEENAYNNNVGNSVGDFVGKRKVKKTPTNESLVEIPVLDLSAAAGCGAYNSDWAEAFDPLFLPSSMLKHRSGYVSFRVEGESMEPTLLDGSHVIARLLDPSDRPCLRNGRIYIVSDRDGAAYIKRVRNRLREQGVLVLSSDNGDKRRFKTFNLSEEELFNVWEVECYISTAFPPVESDSEIEDRFDRIESAVDSLSNAVRVLSERL